MSKRGDSDLLDDILEAITRIDAYTSNMNVFSFLQDTKTQDAVIRNLEILGEAAKGVSPELRGKHVDVPWKNMAAVRNRLIHDYSGVNLDIVWAIITEELPAVERQIRVINQQERAANQGAT